MNKTAIISGVTGQDGSWLAKQLLSKGYKVIGAKRRTSTFNSQRIDDIYDNPNFKIEYFELTDASSIYNLISKYKPEEYYNLAAQSHVRVSFDAPESTMNGIILGTLYALEAIKNVSPTTKFYQASSSEMFGDNPNIPTKGFNENSEFKPASPYAIAKVAAHNLVRNYRESYKIHASCGILFNHECFFKDTPIIIKENEELDVRYISSLVANRTNIDKDTNILTKDYTDKNISVWDGENFVKLKTVSRKKLHLLENKNQNKRIINCRAGMVSTTPNHKLINEFGLKAKSDTFTINDKLKIGFYPHSENKKILPEFAFILGVLCGDGYIDENNLRFSNNNMDYKKLFVEKCKLVFCNVKEKFVDGISGFKNGNSSYVSIDGLGSKNCNLLKEMIYDAKTGHKKIPKIILNSNFESKKAFLDGYYLCDGLKKDKCLYEYKSFTTNSPILAQGLLILFSEISKQEFNINVFEQNNKIYYRINLNKLNSAKGNHLLKNKQEIKKIISKNVSNQHVYDIETESGVVMAGIGKLIVGNSEYRGETFVTRKITRGAVQIGMKKIKKLELGNLDAKRDWGYAPEYTDAMWRMLQQEKPDDYVIATGETHTVGDFLYEVFQNCGGISVNANVKINPVYFRPHEVPLLLGDATKAREILKWEPKTKFKDLAKLMYDFDLKNEVEKSIFKQAISYGTVVTE